MQRTIYEILKGKKIISYVGSEFRSKLEESKSIIELFRSMSSNIEFASEFLEHARSFAPTQNFWRCFQGVVMPELAHAVWENRFWYEREKVSD